MEKLEGIVNPSAKGMYNSENQLVFSPLLYTQRYIAALNCIMHEKFKKRIKSILEFGCSEMKFFTYLKNGINDRDLMVKLVDIDRTTLITYMTNVQPLISERIRRRAWNLEVEVWRGDIAKQNPNFTNVDAVVALELIEHVFPDVLEEIPFNIFGVIAPKIAVFSTPNCEYNQLFKFEPGRVFRHDDHKFEWNREQFADWCENITQRFPNYSVQIEQIGYPPNDDQIETIGGCSQMGIFVRKDFVESLKFDAPEAETTDINNENEPKTNIPCEGYELMQSISYPVFKDTRDHQQKVFDEANYHINRLRWIDEDFYNNDTGQTEIPVQTVANACWETCDDKDTIFNAIKDKYLIENDVIILNNDEFESDEEEHES